MPAYSPSLRVELITSGDQAGQWGNTTNSNFQYIFDSAIAGYVPITVGNPIPANYVLTYSNGPVADENLNQSIAAMLQLNSAAAAFNVFAPPVSKQYIIWNNSGYAATIYNSSAIGNTTAAGLGVIIANGEKIQVFSDGTNFYASTPKLFNSVANGVVYVNSSNQVTNGTALTFDGTNLGVGTASTGGYRVAIVGSVASSVPMYLNTDATNAYLYSPNPMYVGSTGAYSLSLVTSNTVRVHVLPSGSVGIKTITPEADLDINGSQVNRGDASGYVFFAPKFGTTPFGANYDRFEIRVDPAVGGVTSIGNVNGGTGVARPLAFLAGSADRMRIAADGNIVVGDGTPTAAGGGRSIDIYNTVATNNNSLSVLRLITSSVAGGGATSGADLYKTKGGAFVLANNETNAAAYTSFGIGGLERMRIDANGNIQVGSSVAAATAPGGGREFDIDNFESTDNNSYAVARLITKNRANSGTANFDIYKAKGGAVLLHNTETDSAAYIDFVIGGSTKATITSGGNLAVTGAINAGGAITSAGVPVVTTTETQTLTNKTLSSNTVGTTQSNGDNSTKLATTAYVQNMGLGWGQTWQNLIGSRALGSDYTNTTGKPIMVSVSISGAPYNGAFYMTIGGVIIGSQGVLSVASAAMRATITAIVPPGAVYRADDAGGASLAYWAELR
jgi:hypothetical protein